MSTAPRREDVEELARWVDEDNEATYLSLYVDLTDRRHRKVLDRRREQLAAVVDRDRVDAVEAAFDEALDELGSVKGGQARGAAVFVSPETGRSRVIGLAEPVATRAVWDTSPYVRPLARFVDDYEGLALVIVDGERAAIHHVEAANPRQVYTKKANLQGRHKSGGWSQMRYQRARETALDKHLDEIVDRLDELVREHDVQQVIIAGSGSVRDRIPNRLPPRLLERLTAVESVDLDRVAQTELLRRLTELGRLREDETSREVATAVLDRVARGELAIAGPFEVARAARDGRVEALVVDEGTEPGAAKCETHGTYFQRGEACVCGSEGTPVDLINEAVEDATRSDARVEFVDDDRLREAGGLAAVLRW